MSLKDEEKIERLQLKEVSSQPSMFSNIRKPSEDQVNQKIKNIEEKKLSYKQKAKILIDNFHELLLDKTLPENKTLFVKSLERENLEGIAQLGIEINQDPNEQYGMGSLIWITFLFRTLLFIRDRINTLEFQISHLDKKFEQKNSKNNDP